MGREESITRGEREKTANDVPKNTELKGGKETKMKSRMGNAHESIYAKRSAAMMRVRTESGNPNTLELIE